MGSVGSVRGVRSVSSVFTEGEPVKIETYYRGQKGYYGQKVFDAKDSGDGVISVDYGQDKEWEDTNAKTKNVTYTVEHGFYTSTSGKDVYDVNINWDNVTAVEGKTYDLRPILRKKGFRWNGSKQRWEK